MKCSKRFLKHVLQTHWNVYACQQLAHRKAFNALAIDIGSYTQAISKVPAHHASAMSIHSCGTHFANDALCHIDGSTNQCPYCESPDSVEHRLLRCPAFSGERVETFGFDDISSTITSTTMRHFCLLPLSENILKLKTLLNCEYHPVQPPVVDQTKLQIFADGSCFFPKDKFFSVAGSAIVLAKHNPIDSVNLKRHLLPGCDHTPHRAEIFGIILSLETGPVIEIWCDCAAVVGDFNTMLSFLHKGTRWTPPDHQDLWEIVLSLLQDRHENVTCNKTKGHVVVSNDLTPQQYWEGTHNNLVDVQAKEAITVDNAELYQKILHEYTLHEEKRQLHQQVIKCQSRIIQKVFKFKNGSNLPNSPTEENAPQNPSLENTLVWHIPFQVDDCNFCIYNPYFMHRVCVWASSLQWENTSTGETSFLELFLQYSYETSTLAPSNGIFPPYYHLYDQNPTVDSAGFLLSHNYLNFGKAVRWIERKFDLDIFPPERRTHTNALRCFGWRGAMWGVRRKVVLSFREQINNFLRPLKLYRSKSLEIAFANPSPDGNFQRSEAHLSFVSPKVAHRQSLTRGVLRK